MRKGKRTHRPDWRKVKIHYSYTVDETARVLGVSKGTVRIWIKKGLPALQDQKPMLILGSDLIAFGKARRAPKQKCAAHECYCVKCRAPRRPFDDLAEFISISPTNGNLRGLCPECGALMHKRMSTAKIPDLEGLLRVSIPQEQADLTDSGQASSNNHLERE